MKCYAAFRISFNTCHVALIQRILTKVLCSYYHCIPPQAGISGEHILIAVNRTWEVLHLISYRSIHSIGVAMLLCAGMWCHIHLALLPGIVRDALYFRKNMASNSGYLDSSVQHSWVIAVQVVIFIDAQLILLASLSIVMIVGYIRARKKLFRRVEPTSTQGQNLGKSHATVHAAISSRSRFLTSILTSHSPTKLPWIRAELSVPVD